MQINIFDEDFYYLTIDPDICTKVQEIFPKLAHKKSYWVAEHDEYKSKYVVWDGDPRDYTGYLHFNNVQLGFFDKRIFIDLAKLREKRINEILDL